MRINKWDVSEANARQIRFVNGHHALSNNSVWNTGSSRPVFQRNQLGFKSFTVDLCIKGDGYAEIVKNRGIVISHLLDPVILTLDGIDHYFKAILNKYSISEKSKQKWHIISFEFVGYEYAETEEFMVEVSTSFNIQNMGTVETPVVLELTPKKDALDIPYEQMRLSILCDGDGKYIIDDEDEAAIGSYDYDALMIDGLCRDPRTGEKLIIEIRNITPGKTVVIDGETGLITEDGVVKIDDIEMWGLPTIQPGDNHITTNNNWLNIRVRYNPRFM